MENRLKELCSNSLEMDKKYYLYCEIKNEFTERLRTVPVYFPHFSIHDGSHSANIIRYLSMLLGAENIKKLSASDLFIICVAAYAHDISMSVSYEMIYEKMNSDDWKKNLIKYTESEQDDLAAVAERLLRFPEIKEDIKALDVYSDVLYIIEETFRSEHARRSAEEIVEKDKLERLFGIRIRNILAEVCRLHGCSSSDILELPYEENGMFDDYIHPRFDAALLALGDLLDMDTERFDKDFLKASTPMLNLSEIHKEKHESIRHFLVKEGIIEIKSNCKRIEVYRAMRDWIDWIKQITEFMSINWNQIAPAEIGGAPTLNKYEILLNNDTKWLEFADARFEISTKHALKLLGSTALYKSKYTFVRELIQNAVDATMKRIYLEYLELGREKEDRIFLEWLLKNREELEKFQIKIELSIEGKCVKFVIKDGGCGISKTDLKRIAKVEEKPLNEREFIRSMPEFFRPSGTFGIGIQSVFAVADSFEAVTRTETEETKKIIFQDAKDGRGYIHVTDCERRNSIGTTVTVLLNPDRFTQEDLKVNDYAFKIYPKEQILYQDMISEINNIHSDIPAMAVRQQKEEYIPVIIEQQEEKLMPHIPKVILEYKCLFENDIFDQKGYLKIKCANTSIEYRYYDVENNCIFNASLCSAHNEKEKLSSIYQLGNHYKNGNTIFYRNSYVQSDYGTGYEYGRDRLYKYIDYSINLLSCNSEEILTLERRGVKESFKPQLDKLISIETGKFIRHIVDYLIEKDVNLNSSLLLIVYQAAREQRYKDRELCEKYKDKLKELEIGGYKRYGAEDEEIPYTAYDLTKKELFFARKYEKKGVDSENTAFSEIFSQDKDIVLLDLDVQGSSSHPLNHRIKKHFVHIEDGIPLEIFVAEPYRKQGNEPYERDGCFKREQLLSVFFANRRCVAAWPGYEDLQTSINSGLRIYGAKIDKMIEMELDLKIKEEMAAELREKGYIKECYDRFWKRIKDTKTYEMNLQYILNICEKDKKRMEELYESFWKKVLTQLEDQKLSAFTLGEIERWEQIPIQKRLMGREEPYGQYVVE